MRKRSYRKIGIIYSKLQKYDMSLYYLKKSDISQLIISILEYRLGKLKDAYHHLKTLFQKRGVSSYKKLDDIEMDTTNFFTMFGKVDLFRIKCIDEVNRTYIAKFTRYISEKNYKMAAFNIKKVLNRRPDHEGAQLAFAIVEIMRGHNGNAWKIISKLQSLHENSIFLSKLSLYLSEKDGNLAQKIRNMFRLLTLSGKIYNHEIKLMKEMSITQ
jgi:tetratricopeptide (TPR) repeat protein